MSESYHHGDLKRQLLLCGIDMILQEGTEKLSLRKAAEKCGVSHGAPYSHFKNKEDYLKAINEFVENEFSAALLEAEKDVTNEPVLLRMAKAYLNFFVTHPSYYSFYMKHADFEIELSETENTCKGLRSFSIFQEAAKRYLHSIGLPAEKHAPQIIKMWSMIQGLTMLAVMPHVHCAIDWSDYVGLLLSGKEEEK